MGSSDVNYQQVEIRTFNQVIVHTREQSFGKREVENNSQGEPSNFMLNSLVTLIGSTR